MRGQVLISQLLRYARVLLLSGWCQGAEGRDECGQPVEPWDVSASSWSLAGAISAVASDAGCELVALEQLATTALAFVLEIPAKQLQAWNDEPQRTQQEVLAACERAIALLPQLVAKHYPVSAGAS